MKEQRIIVCQSLSVNMVLVVGIFFWQLCLFSSFQFPWLITDLFFPSVCLFYNSVLTTYLFSAYNPTILRKIAFVRVGCSRKVLLKCASGIKEGMIRDEQKTHGLEKCTTLEEQNRVHILKEIGVFVYKGQVIITVWVLHLSFCLAWLGFLLKYLMMP